MDVADFKRWHWVAIGLMAGLVLSGMRIFFGPAYRDSTARTLSQEQFESALLRPALSMQVRNMVLHPPDKAGNCWVTGDFSEIKSYAGPGGDNEGPRTPMQITGPFKYKAAANYKPRLWLQGMPRGQTALRAYLDAITARMPGKTVSYRYAWWEHNSAVLAIWTGGTVFLVGGLWPTLLNILIGASFASRRVHKEHAYDLSRFGKGPETPIASAVSTSGEQADLAEMAAELEKELQAEPSPAASLSMPSPPPAPVRVLAGKELEAPVSLPEDEKHYAGEFYPTAAHASQEDER